MIYGLGYWVEYYFIKSIRLDNTVLDVVVETTFT